MAEDEVEVPVSYYQTQMGTAVSASTVWEETETPCEPTETQSPSKSLIYEQRQRAFEKRVAKRQAKKKAAK